MKVNKMAKWLRLLLLIGLLGYITYESYLHQVLGGGKAPSAHALCPYGALESLYTLLFMGTFIQKIYTGTLVLLAVTVALALLFRRSFCGLLCPFGALQELFARLGKKLFKKRLVIPRHIDQPLRYLKYLILLLTVGTAWYYGTLWMSPYDPYAAYAHITAVSDTLAEEPLALIGFMLLIVTIIGSFLYDRFFCKYLCPMGAFYGLIGKLSATRIERNDQLCTHCKICNKACPVNIEVDKAAKVTDAECINCNECVVACPKKGALTVKTAGKSNNPLLILALVAGLFFGSILIAQATGNYTILPEALKNGETILVSEIKGYYTIEEAAVATGLSLQEVYEKLGIPDTVSKNTKMKEISDVVAGFDFDAAKEKASENPVQMPVPATGSTNPKIDVSGIKGSMTIRQAAEYLKMDLPEFYQLFKIPETVQPQIQMKGIADVAPGYVFEQIKESLK